MPWTPEEAREAGRKGGTARAARVRAEAAKPPAERARKVLEDQAPALAEMLLKAAKGENEFKGLDPKDRKDALVRALEWVFGKPVAPPRVPKPPSGDDGEPAGGLLISGPSEEG